MIITQFLIKETSAGHLKGFWVFNVPFYVRWMFQVGRMLHMPAVLVIVAKDYFEAISGATGVLRDEDIDVTQHGTSPNDEVGGGKTFTEDQLKSFGNELIRFIGSVNWDRVGLSLDGISEGHPLQTMFEALALVKLDLDDLLEEREKAQIFLRESEERYRMILESIEDGYFEIDLRGNFTFFNTALA
jgi:PAS domain-containing protein